MKAVLHHPTVVVTAASLILLSVPATNQAGPDVGNFVVSIKRVCPEFVPRVENISGAKAWVVNTSDPEATFGNQVVVSGRKGRTRVNFETSFDGLDTINVRLKGRDLAKAPGSSGGTRPQNYRMQGTGPAFVTDDSFGTKAGVGKLGRRNVRYSIVVRASGKKLKSRLIVKAPRRSPIGSSIRMFF